jgi:hypothetical protein
MNKLLPLLLNTGFLIPISGCVPIISEQSASVNAVALSTAVYGFTSVFTQSVAPTTTQVMSAINR